jgi:hypothetical protein
MNGGPDHGSLLTQDRFFDNRHNAIGRQLL